MIVHTSLKSSMLTPDVGAIAREMTTGSQIGMIISRVRKLSFPSCVRLGLNNLVFLPQLAKKDFAAGIKLLCELEILLHPTQRTWVLHNQMTDMAIALQNTRLLQYFFVLAKTYGFHPGIATYNPERCITLLAKMRQVPQNLIIYCPKSSPAFEAFAKEAHLHISWIKGEI